MDRRFVIVNDNDELLLEVLKRAEGRSVLVRNTEAILEMVSLEMPPDNHSPALTRHPIEGLSDTTTLNEAYIILSPKRSGEVFIYQDTPDNIVGVISWAALQKEINSGKI